MRQDKRVNASSRYDPLRVLKAVARRGGLPLLPASSRYDPLRVLKVCDQALGGIRCAASSRYDPLRVLKEACCICRSGCVGASSRYDPLRVLKVAHRPLPPHRSRCFIPVRPAEGIESDIDDDDGSESAPGFIPVRPAEGIERPSGGLKRFTYCHASSRYDPLRVLKVYL